MALLTSITSALAEIGPIALTGWVIIGSIIIYCWRS